METNSNKISKTSSKSGHNLKNSKIVSRLLHWYKKSGRSLPWRKTKNPYRIWISEIVLQQTRVKQGLPYYLKLIQAFPTVKDLARAREDKVLRLWQGLGYYSRARNLHHCAKIIYNDFNGRFPGHYNQLLKLPGIGKYTAAAIASIAFNEVKAVVDGNVYRVLSRLYNIHFDISKPSAQEYFQDLAGQLISRSSPGDFNQAIMELGAMVCLPKEPLCNSCPLNDQCRARSGGWQHELPVNNKKINIRKRKFKYYVIHFKGKILMHKREKNDIWKGLYEFYLVEKTKGMRSPGDKIIKLLEEKCKVKKTLKVYESILSHQSVKVQFRHIWVENKEQLSDLLTGKGLKPYTIRAIENLPKPVLISNYLKEVNF